VCQPVLQLQEAWLELIVQLVKEQPVPHDRLSRLDMYRLGSLSPPSAFVTAYEPPRRRFVSCKLLLFPASSDDQAGRACCYRAVPPSYDARRTRHLDV
jgi:hypothetical protein